MASATEGKSNLSFVLRKPHDVTFEQRPVPAVKSPHDVLVAVNYTGICGSDVHYWEHGAIGHFVVKDPMVLGHESAGTIVAVGDEVTALKPGDRVALEPGYPCRRCVQCLSGHYNLCPLMQFAATPPYDGTLTGFWSAPFDFCYRLPDHVSLQEGALIEPLAVAVHIVGRQARVQPGQSVVVMGAGPVGLLCCAVARAFGASKVVAVDIVPSKLAFAKEFAATHTYVSQRVSPEENARNIVELADLGPGADVVIDASGAEPSIQASLHVVRVGGTYVQGGMGKPDITFPIVALCIKEVTVRGSFRYGSGDYKLAIELVASGKVDVKRLITATVPFESAEEAFQKVKTGEVIKILIAGPNEAASKSGAQTHEAKAEEVEAKADQPAGSSSAAAAAAPLEQFAVGGQNAAAAQPEQGTTGSAPTTTTAAVENKEAEVPASHAEHAAPPAEPKVEAAATTQAPAAELPKEDAQKEVAATLETAPAVPTAEPAVPATENVGVAA